MNIKADGIALRDELGRQRIFRGENICFKRNLGIKRFSKYLNNHFDYLVKAGCNIVRLGVTWELLEPKENKYNTELVELLHSFVKRCEKQGIVVMLDMHQDLYSRHFFGDGMPSWVIDKSIKPQRYMAIWAEGYFYMNSVQQAFNDFWQNQSHVQDKFVKMWKFYRSQFYDCENIIGNDYLNEPYITSYGRKLFMNIVNRVIKLNYNIDIDAESYFDNKSERLAIASLVKDLAKIIEKNGGARKLLNDTDSYEQFSEVISGLEKYTTEFNSKYYQTFIDKLDSELGKDTLSLFEHNYFSNLGIPFEIKTKGNYIYSPHAYDLFVDSALYNKFSSNNRIKFITDEIRKNQLKMNVPVIFGEWGCGANNGNLWIDHIEYVMDIMEKNQWSNIYWSYRHLNKEFTNRINRPYPIAICGDIIEYKTDSKNRSFTLVFEQKEGYENTENEIYIPRKGIYRFSSKVGKHKLTLKY